MGSSAVRLLGEVETRRAGPVLLDTLDEYRRAKAGFGVRLYLEALEAVEGLFVERIIKLGGS